MGLSLVERGRGHWPTRVVIRVVWICVLGFGVIVGSLIIATCCVVGITALGEHMKSKREAAQTRDAQDVELSAGRVHD